MYDERLARQYRYEPPPEFPWASTFTGIVHHLPVLTDMFMFKPLPVDGSAADAKISVLTFIAHVGFDTQELAHMLDSLVRVSRRVE